MTDSDQLRTVLANERTLLAYIRTALSAWIFGMAAVKFFSDNFLLVCLGWIVTVFGTATLLWGFWQFKRRHRMMNESEVNKK